MSYCEFVRDPAVDPHHREYHDTEYGFPIYTDAALFERLVLEINQAGLSWLTILKKRAGFRAAYAEFDIARVAAFGEQDRRRLLQDPTIIRNRLKVEAAIMNARTVLQLASQYGSFARWLDSVHPADLAHWRKLFKQTFVFTGGEIVREFLLSAGYLAAAHDEDCPAYQQILNLDPPWRRPLLR